MKNVNKIPPLPGIEAARCLSVRIIKTDVTVDASLVAPHRRPWKVIEGLAPGEGELSISEYSGAKVSYSDDVEANWTVKGKRPHYGYKVHMGTDAFEGFVLVGHVTAAHVSDSVKLEPLVGELSLPGGALVLGDKGYVRQRNEAVLEARGLKNGIMKKAWRDHPLPNKARTRNLDIGELR